MWFAIILALVLQSGRVSSDDIDDNNAQFRCGVPRRFGEQLIHHAWASEPGQWPWHVALYHGKSNSSQEYKCGGTLIDQRHVLTAAHCVVRSNGKSMSTSDLSVHLGKYNLGDQLSRVQIKVVENIHVHPNFSRNRHDIAILELEDPVRFSDYVIPICLGDLRESDELEGERGWVAGWGLTETGDISETLKTARMPVVNNTECVSSDHVLFGRFISAAVFCASDRNGTSVCLGDSGGGMYFSSGGYYELRGIVSFAGKTPEGNCETNKYIIVTNVDYYHGWIRAITFGETNWVDVHQPKRISEKKCLEYAKFAKKEKNGVCENNKKPHEVQIYYRSEQVCFGNIISEQFVINAIYPCTINRSAKDLQIRYDGRFHSVKEIYRHPGYVDEYQGVNLALMKLREPLTLSGSLLPACLANTDSENLYDDFRKEYQGTRIFHWLEGNKNLLMPREECLKAYGKLTRNPLLPIEGCATLIDQVNYHFWQFPGIPVVKFNSRNCQYTILGLSIRELDYGKLLVFTRVAPVLDWIEQIVWAKESEGTKAAGTANTQLMPMETLTTTMGTPEGTTESIITIRIKTDAKVEEPQKAFVKILESIWNNFSEFVRQYEDANREKRQEAADTFLQSIVNSFSEMFSLLEAVPIISADAT
ncbi:ovochymase-2-like [Uranotaenia lowii]|uniref:ovochymase-2-like n=1 Tax=Uranotaenia lowii TaxID=190385 RepID=UPI00247AC1DC|nr:ovochymase-2-like [Uranotaenia lowii]